MIKKHLELLLKTKNYKVAMLEIRSHAAWYLKGLNNGKSNCNCWTYGCR